MGDALIAIISLAILWCIIHATTDTTPKVAQRLATMPINFAEDTMHDLLEIAERTGKHYNNVFLRDRTAELLDEELMSARSEADLLRLLQTEQASDNAAQVALHGPPFKPEEPQRLAEYEGQPQLTVPLQKAIQALEPDRQVIDHKLFTGLPGLGKTLIAKVVANELHLRALQMGRAGVAFFWSFAANLNKPELLDAFVREIAHAKGGVWFIDELHVFDHQLQTKIYSLMEDGLYPFEGDTNPTRIDEVMIIGATTDYGGLHPALKRRFGETMRLHRLDRSAILRIITSRAFPIQDGAAELLADRTQFSGAPWEAIILRREAEIFAKASGRAVITEQDVQDVFAAYAIDEQGLRREDRDVITALFKRPRTKGKDNAFVCFGASEQDICAVAGLDPEEYRETVKPRLLARDLIAVKSGYGQILTENATTRYSHLKV